MGPQHKRVYARLRRTMRGDDRLKLAASRCGGRAAPPRWTGDAGRYSRSFGLSASLASPPCGEWKAYRVTAAIARNSIESRFSHAASTSTIYQRTSKGAGDANRHGWDLAATVKPSTRVRPAIPSAPPGDRLISNATSLQERMRSLRKRS